MVPLAVPLVDGQTCYVATNGSDSNPGSLAQPFRTITHAYSLAGPGTNIIVLPGVYTDFQSGWGLHLNSSGTASSPIMLESQVYGGAIIDGQNATNRNLGIYLDGSYNVVDGFGIRNGPNGGISIYGHDNQILHSEIYSNGNPYNTTGNGLDGIYDGGAYGSYGSVFVGNYIHDNGRISQATNLDQGIYIDGSTNELIMNNLIVGNCSHGIQVAGDTTPVSGLNIYNNTIVSNRFDDGIVLWSSVEGVHIVNNIIYGNARYGITTVEVNGSGVQISTNLFYTNNLGAWNLTNTNGVFTYTAVGNITNNPEFFNPANDWHVEKGSPAIDSGALLSVVTNDYDGLPRPIPVDPKGLYDIGAYER